MTDSNCARWESYLVYLLPVLHLVGCVPILPTRNLQYITLADFPVSIIFVLFAYQGVDPVILFLTIGVVGTLWWYLLSLGLRWIVRSIANQKLI